MTPKQQDYRMGFSFGYDAFVEGRRVDDCAFDDSTPEWAGWTDGWFQARADHRKPCRQQRGVG